MNRARETRERLNVPLSKMFRMPCVFRSLLWDAARHTRARCWAHAAAALTACPLCGVMRDRRRAGLSAAKVDDVRLFRPAEKNVGSDLAQHRRSGRHGCPTSSTPCTRRLLLRHAAGQSPRGALRTTNDRSVLNDIVADSVERAGSRINAFCWMTNHPHALVQISDAPLGRIMKRTATRGASALLYKHPRPSPRRKHTAAY